MFVGPVSAKKPNILATSHTQQPRILAQTMTVKDALFVGSSMTVATAAGAGWVVSYHSATDVCKPAGPLVASVAMASILTMGSAYLYSQKCQKDNQHYALRVGGYVSSLGVFSLAGGRAAGHIERAVRAQSWRLACRAVPAVACTTAGAMGVAACLYA